MNCSLPGLLLSMEFSRQKYCSGLPFPSPGDLPDPRIEPTFAALQADSFPLTQWRSPIWLLHRWKNSCSALPASQSLVVLNDCCRKHLKFIFGKLGKEIFVGGWGRQQMCRLLSFQSPRAELNPVSFRKY